jgi:hypothetical protein
LSDFWERMDEHFGHAYARSWSRDQKIAELGGLTVDEALLAGVETREVWLAVWEHERMPGVQR